MEEVTQSAAQMDLNENASPNEAVNPSAHPNHRATDQVADNHDTLAENVCDKDEEIKKLKDAIQSALEREKKLERKLHDTERRNMKLRTILLAVFMKTGLPSLSFVEEADNIDPAEVVGLEEWYKDEVKILFPNARPITLPPEVIEQEIAAKLNDPYRPSSEMYACIEALAQWACVRLWKYTAGITEKPAMRPYDALLVNLVELWKFEMFEDLLPGLY